MIVDKKLIDNMPLGTLDAFEVSYNLSEKEKFFGQKESDEDLRKKQQLRRELISISLKEKL